MRKVGKYHFGSVSVWGHCLLSSIFGNTFEGADDSMKKQEEKSRINICPLLACLTECCLYLPGVHRLVRALYFDSTFCRYILFPPPFMHFRRERSTDHELCRRGVCVDSNTCASSSNYVRNQVKQQEDVNCKEQQAQNSRNVGEAKDRASNAALRPVYLRTISWASFPFFPLP